MLLPVCWFPGARPGVCLSWCVPGACASWCVPCPSPLYLPAGQMEPLGSVCPYRAPDMPRIAASGRVSMCRYIDRLPCGRPGRVSRCASWCEKTETDSPRDRARSQSCAYPAPCPAHARPCVTIVACALGIPQCATGAPVRVARVCARVCLRACPCACLRGRARARGRTAPLA